MMINFKHKQHIHPENGVTYNLLNYHGVQLSEPMIFGIGSGLFMGFFPFLKQNGIPIATFRTAPGMIFQRATKRLGIKIKKAKYRNPKRGMSALDKALDKGIPVGLQVGLYHLTYFPQALRFHFNMHNIVVYGKKNGMYQISDPILENTTELSYDELVTVRYAKGPFSPNGKMYYPTSVPRELDLKPAIRKGIAKTCKDMVDIPVPLFGHTGYRFIAKRMKNWPTKLGEKTASMWLEHFIRMMEEIGTGGAGFRFIYSAFLQEAADELNEPWLKDISTEMTANGDLLREFALHSSKICKNRATQDVGYDQLADMLIKVADNEKEIFTKLKKLGK